MVTHVQAWDATKERRISYLARPKVNHQIVCNRVSVYWTDKLPSKTHRVTVPVLTPRQEELSQSKKVDRGLEENRPSPVWPMSTASKHAVASPRLKELAQPKLINSAWEVDRPVCTVVSRGAMAATAQERTIHLAIPKKRDFSARVNTPPVTPRSISQLTRTQYLARPKTEHPSYLHDKPVRWPVSAGARNTIMSARLSELAHPKVRKQIFEGYDPYRISRAALHAEASPRLQELSIPRRVRKKGL
ncbi:sperm microtubule associated protein 2 [Carettochelys insculpta]|uniref:sperm microtubule associated protein 2 n=1 Tax=Carettochelys insculpta TaxID=44489 RepID=UPI003EBBD50C